MNTKMIERLIELRKQHGYSQEQLADKLNISRQAVSKWECGDSYPDTEKLIALADFYGTSLDYLVKGEKDEVTYYKVTNHDRKIAIKIIMSVFGVIGTVFTLIGTAVYLFCALPETLDMQLANDTSITPLLVMVDGKKKSNINDKYTISYTWVDNQVTKRGNSNPIFTFEEANELIGTQIEIRVKGDKSVMVDYHRSDLSTLGYVFLGTFCGIGVIFLGVSVGFFMGSRRKL